MMVVFMVLKSIAWKSVWLMLVQYGRNLPKLFLNMLSSGCVPLYLLAQPQNAFPTFVKVTLLDFKTPYKFSKNGFHYLVSKFNISIF